MDAIVKAGLTRFRPVVLTAVTTILGLLPMVLGVNIDIRHLQVNMKSESSIFWGQMAAAVVFGLAVSTLLVLIVAPAMYMALERVRRCEAVEQG